MKNLPRPFTAIALASLVFISGCMPEPHYVPYGGWSMWIYGQGLLNDGANICTGTAMEARLNVKCHNPMQRLEIVAVNDSTQTRDTLFATDLNNNLEYTNNVMYQLNSPGYYKVLLLAYSGNQQRQVDYYDINAATPAQITVAQPVDNVVIPYNNQAQSFDISGTLDHVKSIDSVYALITSQADITPLYRQAVALTGNGNTRTYSMHANTTLPIGDYKLQVYATQTCMAERDVLLGVGN